MNLRWKIHFSILFKVCFKYIISNSEMVLVGVEKLGRDGEFISELCPEMD